MITKKYRVPAYVNVNGFFDLYDYMGVLKAVLEYIDEKFDNKDTSRDLINQ